MNDIKSFTIYQEYYDLITLLEKEEQQELLLAIVEYVFNDKKPVLNDKQMKIFINLKRPLDKSKNRSKSSSKQKQNKNKIKTKKKQNKNTSNDVNVSNYDNNYVVNGNVNVNKIENKYFESIKVNSLFNEFLELRKKLKAVNSERAINSLVNKLNNYDEDTQYKMIENSIVNSWKNVYELKEKETLPYWFNNEPKENKDGLEELNNLLEDFK